MKISQDGLKSCCLECVIESNLRGRMSSVKHAAITIGVNALKWLKRSKLCLLSHDNWLFVIVFILSFKT